MPLYVVDTNFFIQAHRSTYPMDVVQSFWKKIKELADQEKFISIDKVRDEIFRNDDELTVWVKQNLDYSFFKSTRNLEILVKYGEISKWAVSQLNQYNRKAIDVFLEYERADAWLVAFGSMHQDVKIVTQEVSSPGSRSKIKLPDACKAFEVPYVNALEMFRELKARF